MEDRAPVSGCMVADAVQHDGILIDLGIPWLVLAVGADSRVVIKDRL